eukprot:5553672-Pyramimonas_sp.AAC.1
MASQSNRFAAPILQLVLVLLASTAAEAGLWQSASKDTVGGGEHTQSWEERVYSKEELEIVRGARNNAVSAARARHRDEKETKSHAAHNAPVLKPSSPLHGAHSIAEVLADEERSQVQNSAVHIIGQSRSNTQHVRPEETLPSY